MTALERLTAYLCSQPGSENMDAHNAYMARQILDQHTMELGRERDASYWRQRFESEANVRWDDGCPPGGMVCATCGEPVESEPCPEHNPKAVLAAQAAATSHTLPNQEEPPDMTDKNSVEDNAVRAEQCANGDCIHARNGKRAARIASEYRYGVEEALDYLSDDRDGITPEVAETLRGILTRAIETPAPTV